MVFLGVYVAALPASTVMKLHEELESAPRLNQLISLGEPDLHRDPNLPHGIQARFITTKTK